MNKSKIEWFLRGKPGYIKCSALKVKKLLKTAKIEDIREVICKLTKEIYPKLDYKILNPTTKSKKKSFSYTPKESLDPNNVLVIPDTHFPFEKQGLLEHCLKIQQKYSCGTVVHIGDEVDLCAISQWEKDPDGFSAGTEAKLAQDKMKIWYKAFPKVHVCIGNHTARPFRMAKSSGIPKKFIKSYEEAWEAPDGWRWSETWEINGVLYTHGTGYSGAGAAIRIATRHRQNTVIGHIHSEAGIQYSASKIDLVWGMQVGGSIDDSSYAAHYAKDNLKKSIIGCGVVINGKLPIYEPMKL
jgi:hypothetical protein